MTVPLSLDALRYASPELRVLVLQRDKYRCRYCNVAVTGEDANIDHVVPFQNGGKTVLRNLVASCRDCNKAKGNSTWRPQLLKGQRYPQNKGRLSPSQKQRRLELRESKAGAKRNGPVVVVAQGTNNTTLNA